MPARVGWIRPIVRVPNIVIHSRAQGMVLARKGRAVSGENQPIGQLLLRQGYINQQQLEEALQAQRRHGGKIVSNLIALGYMDAQRFTHFLARTPGLASINLSTYPLSDDIVRLVPEDLARKYEVIVVDKLKNALTVGMVCPLDHRAIADLEWVTGCRVRALLCAETDIREALERFYGEPEAPELYAPAEASAAQELPQSRTFDWTAADSASEASFRVAGVGSLIRELDELPGLPQTVRRVQEAIDDEELSIEVLSEIISGDPALAAKILTLANSPAYLLPNQVHSLQLAVSLLGLKEVYALTVSAAVVDIMSGAPSFDYKHFWLRSQLCAGFAKATARVCKREKLPGVFVTGLLMDIGQAALAKLIPDRYHKIFKPAEAPDWHAQELHELGISHAEIGYLLTEQWGLPKLMGEAMRFHHDIDMAPEDSELAAIGHIADQWAACLVDETQSYEATYTATSKARAILGIYKAQWDALAREVEALNANRGELEAQWQTN